MIVTLDFSVSGAFNPQTLFQEISIKSSEGASSTFNIYLQIIKDVAKLRTFPDSIVQSVLLDTRTSIPIVVSNYGSQSANIEMGLPDIPWMKSSVNTFTLEAGKNFTFNLVLLPSSGVVPINTYIGKIAFNFEEGTFFVPFNLQITSNENGTLEIEVVDEFTYYAEGSPRVAEASITLIDSFGEEIKRTAFDGTTSIELLSGYYELTVGADKHGTYRSVIFVQPGTTTSILTFISRQLVDVYWKVVPTEIPDEYDIILETVFETYVPVPVLTITPNGNSFLPF